jgi:hypothetical protein
MKDHLLEHDENCDSHICREREFVVVLIGEMHIIRVPYCLIGLWRDHEFIFNLLYNSTDKRIKMYKNRYGDKAWGLWKDSNMREHDFKEYRLRGKRLKKWAAEICYTYYDNAGKDYHIFMKLPFMKKLISNDQLKRDYREIQSGDYSFSIKEQAEILYDRNYAYTDNEDEIRKTIAHLQKEIRRKINQNQIS